ncbi:FAD-dependent thymidylate synthase [Corynebacterium striatum]|uniref:FAD-dependent thymidylate synthase n=1 Tax=Corynebacterium striatum TaxID=43770 RepID=UPI0027BAB05F|nr:FAD-dependent thymidylate synthase [Corynebacterium striatum]
MIITKPKVTLLAHTMINREAIAEHMEIQGGSTDAETLTTFAGRACYQSFHRPNKKTFHDRDYLRRTLFEQGHMSIAEHATATLYFEGVSRALTHELIRHRHLSYSQLSQRFVDEKDAAIVIPPAIRDLPGIPYAHTSVFDYTTLDEVAHDVLETVAESASETYTALVDFLTNQGLPRKQAREAARAVLPNMVETRIVVTGNLRAWHEVIQRRTQPDADAEIQEVMNMAREQLATIAPVLFGDSNA